MITFNGDEARPIVEPQIMPKTFRAYQILQRRGEIERIIAWGLTLQEARALSKKLKPRPIETYDNAPVPSFELEIHQIAIDGKSRYVEFVNPALSDSFQWVG